jgi:hypothetical protein
LQLAVVVDLAIVRDDDPPARIPLRLMASRGKIPDREPAMAEADPSFVPDAEVIRAAMLESVCHPPKDGLDNRAT